MSANIKPVSDQTDDEWIADYTREDSDANPVRLNPPSQAVHSKGMTNLGDYDLTQIPDGSYMAECTECRLENQFGGRLVCEFQICEGRYSGSIVLLYYNVKLFKGPNGTPRYKPKGRQSRLVRDIRDFFGARVPRFDRLPISLWDRYRFRVEVSTVTNDQDGNQLTPCNQYSKVKRLVEKTHDPIHAKR